MAKQVYICTKLYSLASDFVRYVCPCSAQWSVPTNFDHDSSYTHGSLGKTRTRGGNVVSCDVARPWQNAATLLRAARTQEMFLKIFRNIFCVRHKCCARGKSSQRVNPNLITSAMLPAQCVPPTHTSPPLVFDVGMNSKRSDWTQHFLLLSQDWQTRRMRSSCSTLRGWFGVSIVTPLKSL